MQLTKEQEQAASHKEGPALVLAVPGSGKTTMLLYRTKKLIESGIIAQRILIITFSKMAAKDMKERFFKENAKEKTGPIFSTIHSFCYSIIRTYERNKGFSFHLLESGKGPNKFRIIKDLFYQKNGYFPSEDQLDTLIREISYVKNTLIDPKAYSSHPQCQSPHFFTIYSQYEKIKKENLWIDFDDMITLTIDILKSHSKILRQVRKAYDFVQVDEGQDTSHGQMQIIQSIVKPHNNLFIVADDDQSIYGFRGADYRALFTLKENYPDLKEYFLSINFRSSQAIVESCRIFIEQNSHRFTKPIESIKEKGPLPKVLRLNSLEAQYKFIIKEMQEKELGQVAILYRNNICALGLVESLEDKSIDFQAKDTKNYFLSHWVVKDIFTIIEFAQDPSQIHLYEKFYYKIKGYVSKENIEYVKNTQGGQSVFDRLLEGKPPTYLQKNLRELKSDFRRLKNMPLSQAFRFIEFDLDYRSYIKRHSQTFLSSEQASLRILFYLKYIGKKCPDQESFYGRIKHLDHLLKGGRITPSPILLSTLHGSKGLEFDTVFIIDLIEDILPSKAPSTLSETEKKERLEEERRLFYVGMSRAKQNLYLISPKTINHQLTEESSFLKQVQEKLK